VQNKPIEKIHSLFQIQERDNHQVLLQNMELHFIDMRAFARQFQEAATKGILNEDMFTNWLALITHNEIPNKEAIAQICKEVEEIKMAAEVLSRYSEETTRRLEYESRMEDWQLYNHKIALYTQKIAEANRKAAESDRMITELRKQLAAMAQLVQDKGISPNQPE